MTVVDITPQTSESTSGVANASKTSNAASTKATHGSVASIFTDSNDAPTPTDFGSPSPSLEQWLKQKPQEEPWSPMHRHECSKRDQEKKEYNVIASRK